MVGRCTQHLNDSNTMREVMTLIFIDADDRVIQPQNQ
jgi:hypothetical protein